MKFNSQICTTKFQSERLLALGLKKETADMCIDSMGNIYTYPSTIVEVIKNDWSLIPLWSIHRLIEMMPMLVNPIRNLLVSNRSVEYQMSEGRTTLIFANENNIYDNVINCIEWLISVDEFNKEYLEE